MACYLFFMAHDLFERAKKDTLQKQYCPQSLVLYRKSNSSEIYFRIRGKKYKPIFSKKFNQLPQPYLLSPSILQIWNATSSTQKRNRNGQYTYKKMYSNYNELQIKFILSLSE